MIHILYPYKIRNFWECYVFTIGYLEKYKYSIHKTRIF